MSVNDGGIVDSMADHVSLLEPLEVA